MCYGTTPNPTNCVEVEQGALTSLATNNVSTKSVNAVASPDNKSLYSISLNGVINMFNRDTSTGALSAMTPATVISSGYHGDGITITSDGKFVYAIGYNASTQASIFVFSRDTSTGVLTAQNALKQDIWSNPRDIEVSPDGKYIYTVGDTSNLYRYTRNTTTGAITSVSGSYNGGTNPQEIAISPDGLHLYTTDYTNDYVRMFRIDQANGNPIALTPAYISAGASSCAPRGIIVSPDGKNVYVTTYSANLIKMYSRDAGTGLLTALLPTSTIAAGGANPKGITLSSDGKSLYVSLFGAFRVGMFFRNATTGVLTALSPAYITTGTATQAPVLSADGKFLYSPNYTQGNITSYTRSVGTTEGATFTKAITGLVTKTTYYYRGYATNSIGTGYSTDSTFTTL
jgi:6-phosphogluconolactonase (cycloisomerase 2 family)